MWYVWIPIGMIIGVLLGRLIFRDKPIGTLRIKKADKETEPYIFLEIDNGQIHKLKTHNTINLRIRE